MLPTREIARATIRWAFPIRLLRTRPLYSAASVLFHVGIILVPLFSLGHVALWQGALAISWPTLAPLAADVLTVTSALALLLLVILRVTVAASRQLSAPTDQALLVVLLFLVVSGLLAAHPTVSPTGARAMLLGHILLGDLTLLLTPTTKIVHCIVFPLTQLVAEVGWHFPASSGRDVAAALAQKEEEV